VILVFRIIHSISKNTVLALDFLRSHEFENRILMKYKTNWGEVQIRTNLFISCRVFSRVFGYDYYGQHPFLGRHLTIHWSLFLNDNNYVQKTSKSLKLCFDFRSIYRNIFCFFPEKRNYRSSFQTKKSYNYFRNFLPFIFISLNRIIFS
jgi:hypothetical protein